MPRGFLIETKGDSFIHHRFSFLHITEKHAYILEFTFTGISEFKEKKSKEITNSSSSLYRRKKKKKTKK